MKKNLTKMTQKITSFMYFDVFSHLVILHFISLLDLRVINYLLSLSDMARRSSSPPPTRLSYASLSFSDKQKAAQISRLFICNQTGPLYLKSGMWVRRVTYQDQNLVVWCWSQSTQSWLFTPLHPVGDWKLHCLLDFGGKPTAN